MINKFKEIVKKYRRIRNCLRARHIEPFLVLIK